MSWMAVGVAGASLVSGIIGGNKADKRAESDAAREHELRTAELQLAQENDRRAGEQYQHYRTTYMPRERELVYDAFENPISEDAEQARSLADVRGSFDTARRSDLQRERSMGINPASGASRSLSDARSLEESRIEGATAARTRAGVRDANFSRQAAVLGMGSPNAAATFSGLSGSMLSSAANAAGYRADRSNALAYDAGASTGSALADLGGSLADWRRSKKDAA